jgi:hypothetical protein
MAALPELAPSHKNRLLSSSSVVTRITYQTGIMEYTTYDKKSNEVLRLISKPRKIIINGTVLKETYSLSGEGWKWNPLEKGGVLRVNHTGGNSIQIHY